MNDTNSLWFYVKEGKKIGPVPKNRIYELIENESIHHDTYIWTSGYDNWQKVEQEKDFKYFLISKNNQAYIQKHSKSFERFFITTLHADGGDETLYGPYTEQELISMAFEKQLVPLTFIYNDQEHSWGRIIYHSLAPTLFKANQLKLFANKRINPNKRPALPFICTIFLEKERKTLRTLARDVTGGGLQVLLNNANKIISNNQLEIIVQTPDKKEQIITEVRPERLFANNKGGFIRFSSYHKTLDDLFYQDNIPTF